MQIKTLSCTAALVCAVTAAGPSSGGLAAASSLRGNSADDDGGAGTIPIVDSPLNCNTTSACQESTVALKAGGNVLCEGVSSCQGSTFICLPKHGPFPKPGANCTRVCDYKLSACQGNDWLGNWEDAPQTSATY
jgi:hypothetical protein